ncbi:MAG: YdcF family protein [Flavobacteriales bacterium]|nr:YdcF family protein [Flavobacteriales bacterium]
MIRLRFIRWGTVLLLVPVLTALAVDWHVRRAVTAGLHDDPSDLPPHSVALVLGTGPTNRDGRPNWYFRQRIEAAEMLLRTGRVEHLLLSGDNGHRGYNEPLAMRAALMDRGVDSTRITLDFAGFDTFDSVVRARKVFGQERFIIVSQRSHNERALYIAHHQGIDAVAFNAGASYGGSAGRIREIAARMKMVGEFLLGTQPRYLGEPVTLGKQQLP